MASRNVQASPLLPLSLLGVSLRVSLAHSKHGRYDQTIVDSFSPWCCCSRVDMRYVFCSDCVRTPLSFWPESELLLCYRPWPILAFVPFTSITHEVDDDGARSHVKPRGEVWSPADVSSFSDPFQPHTSQARVLSATSRISQPPFHLPLRPWHADRGR